MSFTLLLVDDQDTVLRVLEYVFTQRGHRVLTARSGAAAVEILRDTAVDAALVDMNMPEMDGFQTVEALAALARDRGDQMRAWMMTGAFSAAAAKRAREAGAVSMLAKPFDFSAFLAELKESLEAGAEK